ncbi:MAG: hypothetical protein NT169_14600 [Chloroflexi bacterium]|nr:hypothetical protein [Chloroflexota bacterium]
METQIPNHTLSHGWQLAIDPENRGRGEHWFDSIRPEAQEAPVPGVIQQVYPGYYGVAWYWLRFVPVAIPDSAHRAQIHFHGMVRYLGEVWLNGHFLGSYEGGEAPFDLDATPALAKDEANLLAVRVLSPGNDPIDGYVLNEVPMGGDYGGIALPVEYRVVPAIRTVDLFARPSIHDGSVPVTVIVRNDTARAVPCRLTGQIGSAMPGGIAIENMVETVLTAAPGEQSLELQLNVAQPHLWDLDDPHLYRVSVRLEATVAGQPIVDEASVRCGFREFRVENGFFRLNGRRIYVRQTHTGNHVPYSQIAPVQPDLVRRDLINAKACGFNSIRFLKGPAWPDQLDFCDELGLMIYEECGGSWLTRDSPHFAERYDRNMAALVRRDRNHPCVTIWGLLNETRDGPIFRHAVEYLPQLRQLDPTRLVLLSSGRWDGQLGIGSLSNPGSADWEYQWGAEAPGAPAVPFANVGTVFQADVPAYVAGLGDVHVYPFVPHTPFTLTFFRQLARDSKPVFLSEYGVGSMMNVVRELRKFEQDNARLDLSDVSTIRSWAEKLEADWQRMGFDGVYPFVEDLLRDSQRLHIRQRLFGFDLIRSNPNLCGFNCTGILDHGLSGEGLWTFTREFKPGIVDALCDGWSPVRWCLLIDPMHAYAGRKIKIEALLANEDVLPPGVYPVRFRISGPPGVVWEKRIELRLPDAPVGSDPPLAVPALSEEITLSGPAGVYELAAYMERGGAPAGGRLKFYLSDAAALPKMNTRVTTWGIEPRVLQWLADHGVVSHAFNPAAVSPVGVILVGTPAEAERDHTHWAELIRCVARGSIAIFLAPTVFAKGDDAVAWLPLAQKGRCYEFRDWIYHKECVAKPHPILAGLQPKGIMDWEYYGPVISHWMFEGQDTPDEVVIGAFAAGYIPGGYFAGVLMGAYHLGAGQFLLNSLSILDNVNRHPAADRLLLNLIETSAGSIAQAPAPVPADLDSLLEAIGYGR